MQGQTCSSTPHFVQPGDYLCDITNQYGITSDAVLTANPGVLVNNSRDALRSGITLALPCPEAACCPTWTYAAKAGDSYNSISQKFAIGFDQLRQANKINTTNPDCCNITCGDFITVPCSPQQPPCGKCNCLGVYALP